MPIELHAYNTPNGRKISVALEEMGLPYNVHIVDITKGQQFEPAFLKISPNNKIPAIIDPEGPGGTPTRRPFKEPPSDLIIEVTRNGLPVPS